MKCVISGSFRKFYTQVVELIDEFGDLGMEVLSPAKSEIVNPGGEFVILKSDHSEFIKDLEQKHLDAIKNADFLYICNPGGYVGKSASVEIGYAHALEKPIYSMERPEDGTLAEFIVVKRPSDIK